MVQSGKEIYVGAVIELNQKQVNLIPSTPINQIDTKGLKLSLDKPLELGKFGDAIDSISKDLDITPPTETLKSIDTPLFKNIADKLINANMRIEALQYEQPPVKKGEKAGQAPDDPQDTTKYIFVASVNWTDDNTKEPNNDFFKLKGLILGISKGFSDNTTGENPEVQKAFQSALQAINSQPALSPSGEDSTKLKRR